jgi:CheY-like chemotaxis protein
MGDRLEKGVLVLVVEDDARTARMLARMLEEDGYTTEVTFDGAAAVGRLAQRPMPDVLVVDYRLPHIDGLAVAAYARSIKPDVRVIVITSYAEVIARAHQTLDPPPVILSKPLVYRDLMAELSRAT